MKINLFICALLIVPSYLVAQSKDLNNTEISKHVTNCLKTNYRPDSVMVSKYCRKACIFIKFNVDKSGNIANLSFGNDTVHFINEALSNAINSLKKDTILISTLKNSGKTIIQPFMYDYELGCIFPPRNKAWTTPEEKYRFLFNFSKDRLTMQHYEENIFNLLNFNEEKTVAIECVLLSPYWTGEIRQEPSY